MKTVIIASIILHAVVIWLAPAYRGTPDPGGLKGPEVSYVGIMADDVSADPAKPHEGQKSLLSRFRSPEAEAAIIEPPRVEIRAEYNPSPPVFLREDIESDEFFHENIPGGEKILERALAEYKIPPVFFEEKVLP